jgi:hypothetical protein
VFVGTWQRKQNIEIESVFLGALSNLDGIGAGKIGDQGSGSRAIENEIQNDIIMIAANPIELSQQLQGIAIQDETAVNGTLSSQDFSIGDTCNYAYVNPRISALENPKDRQRDNHIADFVVTQDEDGLHPCKFDRQFSLPIPEEKPKNRIDYGIP